MKKGTETKLGWYIHTKIKHHFYITTLHQSNGCPNISISIIARVKA